MKRLVLYLILSCTAMTALSQKAEEIIFSGTTDTIYNGYSVVVYTGNKIDSAKIIKGKFTITVPFNGPEMYKFYSTYELRTKRGITPFGILVSNPGVIGFKVDMASMQNSIVTNAPDNELYSTYMKAGSGGQQKVMEKLKEKYGEETVKKLKASDANYKEIIGYYNELNAANVLAEAARLEAFIKKNPNSFAPMYVLYGMLGSLDADKIQLLYNQLGAKYKATSRANDIIKKIESLRVTAIGKIAPDFEQPDTTGKMFRLSSLRGKYVLIDFWASWCGPCRAENPNVVKAYQKYHDKGFTVLGVSLDQPGKKNNWLKAIQEDHLTWTQVSDLQFWDNKVAKLYGIRAIPQNFLLDKSGKILAVNVRGEDLLNKLKEIFPD